MADVVFVLIVATFFGMCTAYVRCCDRMVRAAEEDGPQTDLGPHDVTQS